MSKPSQNYCMTDTDRRCLERVRDMLPSRIFDMHIHLYARKLLPGFAVPGGAFALGPDPMRFDDYFKCMRGMFPDAAELRACSLTVPDKAMKGNPALVSEANEFLLDELAAHPDCMGALAVLPATTVEDIEGWLRLPNVRGFKCYHAGAARTDSFNAAIGEYLPESCWQVADRHEMFITLHMVRDRALSDSDNLEYIIAHCKKYPGARLVLAHAARGFCSYNTTDSISKLRGIDNVHFDASAICEPQALVAILREFGPRRLLWGSDHPISQMRGKCITIADSFLWIYADDIAELQTNTSYDMALVGVENLLAMRQAAEQAELSPGDIEDVFWGNAMRMGGFIK